MKQFYRVGILISCLLFFVHIPTFLYAQREGNIWHFGTQAGVTFNSGNPVAISNGQLSSYEACASISTPAGNLIMYSDGEKIWDAMHQLMPNGSNLGGHTSASQGALILHHPGTAAQYLVFTVDAIDNNLVGGLRYSVVDMALRGGLGDVVTSAKSVRLPTPTPNGKVTEKLTAALHANGRDYWIVVHGWQSNIFYSFLLSPIGISSTPVVSSVGPVHTGGGSFFGAANAVGYMKISPLGTHLALAQRDSQFELYSFDKTTGSISNYIPLSASADHYSGIEFSPDNSRLYTSSYADGGYSSTIYQYNLQAGSAGAIGNSRQTVTTLSGISVALQLGIDRKIYISSYNRPFLHVITLPNLLGTACGFSQDAVPLGARVAQVGLPNFPNSFPQQITTAAVSAPAVCVGEISSLSVALSPVTPAATHSWNFGEPASGAANTGSGATPTHTYAAAGTYTATVTTTLPGSASPITTTQTVTVNQLPTVSLGTAVQTLCSGQTLILTASMQPTGSTYRWQDASTGSSLAVTQPGVYSVTVTSPQGCSSVATATVSLQAMPIVRLGADTTVCLEKPLLLRANPQPAGATYRWQDGSSNSTFLASVAGNYTLDITLPSGCVGRDEIVIRDAQCPFNIPNVITPNSDLKNDAFVLKGINPQNWRIEIYNRWGRKVYQQARYDNSWKAEGQSAGVYYYLLHNPQTGQQYKGWVEVVR